MNPAQADLFGAPHPTYVPENAPTETQGRMDMQTACGCWGSGDHAHLCSYHEGYQDAKDILLDALEEIQRNCEPWAKADNMAGRINSIVGAAIAKVQRSLSESEGA